MPADYTFRSPEDRCYHRTSCPGYCPELCFNANHLSNDEWCELHKEAREFRGIKNNFVLQSSSKASKIKL